MTPPPGKSQVNKYKPGWQFPATTNQWVQAQVATFLRRKASELLSVETQSPILEVLFGAKLVPTNRGYSLQLFCFFVYLFAFWDKVGNQAKIRSDKKTTPENQHTSGKRNKEILRNSQKKKLLLSFRSGWVDWEKNESQVEGCSNWQTQKWLTGREYKWSMNNVDKSTNVSPFLPFEREKKGLSCLSLRVSGSPPPRRNCRGPQADLSCGSLAVAAPPQRLSPSPSI